MATTNEKVHGIDSSDHSDNEKKESVAGHDEHVGKNVHDIEPDSKELSAVFENPLSNIPHDQLMRDVEEFCQKWNLMDSVEVMKRGALVAQRPAKALEVEGLTSEEREHLINEKTHKWRQPKMLYYLTIMCSLAAATQGMDETANNGAIPLWTAQFRLEERYPSSNGLHAAYIQGLIVGAPYLACAVLGCWLNEPLNKLFARRGTIFISCIVAAVASIWEGVVQSWPNLFVARFVLGLGIGAKSSTVPVYAAETAPAAIRGALVMQWQVWTAFGIMLGNIMGVAFGGLRPNLAWRLMLGSTVVMPLLVCVQVYLCPESPRWLIQNDRVGEAFTSFKRLRNSDIQAARDLYYTYVGVQLERKVHAGKNFFTQLGELFTVPRNRRASLATFIVMFGQQFCGVNIIAYYSTNIFTSGGYSLSSALLVSMGTGILNWVFALPAFFTIDKYGRRPLLLTTYPFLCIFHLWAGLSFLIGNITTRTAMITTGLYLFEVFYSPGMGPVPFSYSAESFPIQVRDVGMAYATATLWGFNFILAFTWPAILNSFTPTGGFGFYAAWCLILWVLVWLFMPETKELTLEELDQVFSVPTWKHSSYQVKNAQWHFNKYFLFQRNQEPLKPLYNGVERLNLS